MKEILSVVFMVAAIVGACVLVRGSIFISSHGAPLGSCPHCDASVTGWEVRGTSLFCQKCGQQVTPSR